jgi:diadenosine tetraphosphate (Ap4A) HIT family hydrolase
VSEQDCRLCASARALTDADVVHRGAHFTASTGMDVPGWVLMWSHRHDAQGLWELTDAESREFGLLLRDVAAAVRTTCGAERTYVLAMGEHALHFHAMVLARTADTPPEFRGPALLAQAAALADRDAARAVAGRLRSALQRESATETVPVS